MSFRNTLQAVWVNSCTAISISKPLKIKSTMHKQVGIRLRNMFDTFFVGFEVLPAITN